MRFPSNFQRRLAAKLCVGCKDVLEMQEWYGPPQSPCQVWWGSDFTRRRGETQSLMFSGFPPLPPVFFLLLLIFFHPSPFPFLPLPFPILLLPPLYLPSPFLFRFLFSALPFPSPFPLSFPFCPFPSLLYPFPSLPSFTSAVVTYARCRLCNVLVALLRFSSFICIYIFIFIEVTLSQTWGGLYIIDRPWTYTAASLIPVTRRQMLRSSVLPTEEDESARFTVGLIHCTTYRSRP